VSDIAALLAEFSDRTSAPSPNSEDVSSDTLSLLDQFAVDSLTMDVGPGSLKRGRPAIGDKPMTQAERDAKRARSIETKQRHNNICILDLETDPFDSERQTIVKPFLAVFHSDRFDDLGIKTDARHPGSVIIWENNDAKLIEKILGFIAALPEKFTIYAHNGGRFDYMFFVSRLRGQVNFKGRGIMSASIDGHALRDSYHVIPESLANLQKDAFDYNNMRRSKRAKFRDEIIGYCVHDCEYLYRYVKEFREQFGNKLTVGQAATAELRKHYPIKRLTEKTDAMLRPYYIGGRVECLKGAGNFQGDYKIYDINSSYMNVMAKYKHPIGDFWDYKFRRGEPNDDTCFLDLTCNNRGAFAGKDENGGTTFEIGRGRFKTTIHEYLIAIKYELISNVEIHECVDCSERTTFEKFVIPRYEKRQACKAEMHAMKLRGQEGSAAWHDIKLDDTFNKLIGNSAYGKQGQNPRNFREHWLTSPHEEPPHEWFTSIDALPDADRDLYSLPTFEDPDYWIWEKPSPRHSYHNVGVAASVTGAARAELLEAMQHARGAIYCDTDSLICKTFDGFVHPTDLGAWDMEDEATRIIVAGKKLYGVWHKTLKKRGPRQLAWGMDPRYTIKCKGSSGLTWRDLERMLEGYSTHTVNPAPTLDRYGDQRYIGRDIRATARLIAAE
jgi:hypothetical protein